MKKKQYTTKERFKILESTVATLYVAIDKLSRRLDGIDNFLTKATMALGLIFIINTLVLGYMYNEKRNESAIDNVKTETLIPANPVPATEQSAPAAPSSAPVPTVPAAK